LSGPVCYIINIVVFFSSPAERRRGIFTSQRKTLVMVRGQSRCMAFLKAARFTTITLDAEEATTQ
jgi:hypothetical protein